MSKVPSTKVLVVDDDQSVLTVTVRILRGAGYDVTARAAVLGTSAAVVSERPDVVLLDLNMPLMSGQQIAALLRRSLAQRPVLIFHTGLPDALLQEQVRTFGADGGIIKCLQPREFVEQFRRIVASARPTSAASRDATGAGGDR